MKRAFIIVLFLMIALLTSCSRNNNKTDKSKNEYQIYYIDSKSSVIVSEGYVPLGDTKEQLVIELLGVLQKDPL